jgi:hypothetical protein
MSGLRLPDPRWVLPKRPPTPSHFLAELHRLAPDGALLFLEGGDQPTELRALMEARQVTPALRPALGTIWPRCAYFSIPATQQVLSELGRIAASLADPEICEHLHLFVGQDVLLQGYDAFETFYVSRLVPEEALRAFCAEAPCEFQPVTEDDGFRA